MINKIVSHVIVRLREDMDGKEGHCFRPFNKWIIFEFRNYTINN